MLEDVLDVWISEAKLRGKASRNFSYIRAYYTDVETDGEVIDILLRIASAYELQLREGNDGDELIIWFYHADAVPEEALTFG